MKTHQVFRTIITLLIFCSLLLSASLVSAQTGTINGQVTLADGGAPLPFVEVFLNDNGTSRYTCTDGGGNYSFGAVTEDVNLFAATGVDVNTAENCANGNFLNGRDALVSRLSSGATGKNLSQGVTADSFQVVPAGTTVVNFVVEEWIPNHITVRGLNALPAVAQTLWFNGRCTAAERTLGGFDRLVRGLARAGRIGAADRDRLLGISGGYQDLLASGLCKN